jgi:uncharacterized membrane protein YphA (DoxX/SURF4 family)
MNLQIVTETLLAKRWVAASWAPIPLRLIVGFGFVAHGYAKLVKGPYVFVGILHGLGVPAPYFMAWLTILIELFGGLAVLLGALVPLVSLPMAAVLLVAMFAVHLPFGFTSIKLMAGGKAQSSNAWACIKVLRAQQHIVRGDRYAFRCMLNAAPPKCPEASSIVTYSLLSVTPWKICRPRGGAPSPGLAPMQCNLALGKLSMNMRPGQLLAGFSCGQKYPSDERDSLNFVI